MGRQRQLGRLLAVLAFVTMSACGGGGDDSESSTGPTRLTGRVVLPDASICTGCSNAGVAIVVYGLASNQPTAPLTPIKTLVTNAQGFYDTGDLTEALNGPGSGSEDANHDGKRSLIIVANVSDTAGIGGIDSVALGSTTRQDYNGNTQVVCVAAVLLTNGTGGPGPGCTVQTTACGASDQNCFKTVEADTLDATRIQRMSEAAAAISSTIKFPDDTPRAACAVINCTNAGTISAPAGCVATAFQASA